MPSKTNDMKLAFTVATPDTADHTMLALRGELGQSFELLARLGYQGVELMVRDPANLDPTGIRTLAADQELAIAAVSTGQLRKEDGLQLCHVDPVPRARAVDRTKQVVDFTAAVGARQVNIGTLRGQLPTGSERAGALDAAAISLSGLLDYAQARNVSIAIEPQNRFVINWLNSVEETLSWLGGFSHSNLSLLFDAYHALFEERSVIASLIRAFPRLSHVQVADSNRLAPGSGQFNFGELVRVLNALGYQEFVSVEILQQPTGAEAAAAAARHLLPFLAEVNDGTSAAVLPRER